MACQTRARTLHPNLLTSRLIPALLRIQLHHVLHRNAAVVPAHHVLHLGYGGRDRLAVLFPHVHPLVHHQLLVVHSQHFIHVLHSLRITLRLHTNQFCVLRQLLSVRRLDRLRFRQLERLHVKQNLKNKPSLRSELTRTSSFPSPLPTRKITIVGKPFCQLQECATSSRSLPIFQKATKPSHSQRENNNEHFLVLLHAEGVIARQLLQHLLEALVYPLTCGQNELPIVFCFFSSARFARFSLMEEKTPKERWGTKEGEDCASALGSRSDSADALLQPVSNRLANIQAVTPWRIPNCDQQTASHDSLRTGRLQLR